MNKITLYHGSPERVEQPLLAKGKLTNDYGQGFYCTENLELAKEWASAGNNNGVANCYELDTDGLEILNLSAPQYNILHWLALLMKYRTIRLSTPIMKQAHFFLMEHYLLDINQYDVIIGYRADDSYFSFARAFVSNEISLHQLSRAMKLGELGEQFVLKSQKAFDKIRFVSGIEPVSFTVIGYRCRIVAVHTQSYEFPLPGSGQFPLLPDTHPYPTVQPSIQAFDVALHVRYSIVIQPSFHVDFYLLHGSDNASAPAPGSELAQFILGLLP